LKEMVLVYLNFTGSFKLIKRKGFRLS